ncbi:Ldh family oxidoreductase [Glaciimonas sp. Gout2]|uniref:Ldh family oxidoreductase n=1 Tax=unclassified Glaciimonas TaxID=2644401 RepID=UPI002B222946|nr:MULTISPECIES: Ldh family oxidoreductase [unclassified Glaciimonas]MEB0014376.1 Ldh family oxidoreductase [Glaciimonas sp. Cout2]MEB0084334.1 Ldh family oxidoreductase [Glaciimonas sp. Gout2]
MKIQIDKALSYCKSVLVALGTSDLHAHIVASHLVESDTKGVRSHGLLRLLRYVDQIETGYIDNRATPVIKILSTGLVQVDARRTWGILALNDLVPVLAENARLYGIAGGSVINCAHTGRIGAFTEALAKDFMWAQIFGGGANQRLREVAPFGGAKAEFDTNPYSISAPLSENQVSTIDFATSATAQGKLLVHRTNRKPVPDGWLIDKEGNPSNDPESFYEGGALLSSGAHKGYGMAFLAELFGEAALGTPHELNWFAVAVDLKRFSAQEEYFSRSEKLKKKIEQSPPATGVAKVMWPGQPELETAESTCAKGSIEYSDLEFSKLSILGFRFGVRL